LFFFSAVAVTNNIEISAVKSFVIPYKTFGIGIASKIIAFFAIMLVSYTFNPISSKMRR